MKADLDKALRERHPLVFRHRLLNDEPIRCGDGWHGLLVELCAALESEIGKLPESSQSAYYAEQIKEKFGTLRFYMSRETLGMEAAIGTAERASATTCDECGRSGKLRGGGWVRTRCDAHAEQP